MIPLCRLALPDHLPLFLSYWISEKASEVFPYRFELCLRERKKHSVGDPSVMSLDASDRGLSTSTLNAPQF